MIRARPRACSGIRCPMWKGRASVTAYGARARCLVAEALGSLGRWRLPLDMPIATPWSTGISSPRISSPGWPGARRRLRHRARARRGSASGSPHRNPLGTPAYMSPGAGDRRTGGRPTTLRPRVRALRDARRASRRSPATRTGIIAKRFTDPVPSIRRVREGCNRGDREGARPSALQGSCRPISNRGGTRSSIGRQGYLPPLLPHR